MKSKRNILIIVENLTVPLDRRVWEEAMALRDAGYTVSVICPKGGNWQAPYEVLEGINIFRHPAPLEADGALGYAVEYASALFWEFVLSIRVHFKVGFSSVQACNPPDLIFIVAAFWKYLFGKAFIFDHHDVSPELYEAKFGKRGLFWHMLKRFERMTFRMADVSIATNDTFKQIAIERGGMAPEDVYIVRSIPNVAKFKRVAPSPELRGGRQHVIGYVGIMGAQDGVDLFIDAMAHLVVGEGRRDVQALIVGAGTEINGLKARAAAAGLGDTVRFTGFLSGEALLTAFSSFDIGVIPDPKNSYNDKISMNKHFEYMTLGIPFVQFDLAEGRRIASDCSLYARDNCPRDLARQLGRLIDDEMLRRELAAKGEARAAALLDWNRESRQLIAAYEKALGRKAPAWAGERVATAG